MTRPRRTEPRLAPTETTPLGLPDLGHLAPPWMDNAACSPDTAELFFPDPQDHAAAGYAVAICRTCPVRLDCAGHAADLDNQALTRSGAVQGVWGGLTPTQRRRLIRTTPA